MISSVSAFQILNNPVLSNDPQVQYVSYLYALELLRSIQAQNQIEHTSSDYQYQNNLNLESIRHAQQTSTLSSQLISHSNSECLSSEDISNPVSMPTYKPNLCKKIQKSKTTSQSINKPKAHKSELCQNRLQRTKSVNWNFLKKYFPKDPSQ